MSDDVPLPDLFSVLRVTEQEIEKRKEGFAFWRCPGCDCDLFRLDSDRGVWFAVCSSCDNEYEVLPDGAIQLFRVPRDE